jgi:hypothetical protein
MNMTVQQAFDEGFRLCKSYIDAEIAAVAERLAKLEQRSAAEVERELSEALRRQMESSKP